MQTFSKTTLAEQGLRFEPLELLQTVEYALLAMAFWWLIAFLIAMAFRKAIKIAPVDSSVGARESGPRCNYRLSGLGLEVAI